jgi:trans-aconitate methyltransferase
LPLENVLDLACGDGLVTRTLQSLGYQRIEGIDPYLSHLYTAATGCRCLNMSFKDIIQKTSDLKYSCIICSFGLHLCDKSMLPSLLWRLSEMSSKLVVVSPSKFPVIGKPEVERFALTPDKKRVHYREYNL